MKITTSYLEKIVHEELKKVSIEEGWWDKVKSGAGKFFGGKKAKPQWEEPEEDIVSKMGAAEAQKEIERMKASGEDVAPWMKAHQEKQRQERGPLNLKRKGKTLKDVAGSNEIDDFFSQSGPRQMITDLYHDGEGQLVRWLASSGGAFHIKSYLFAANNLKFDPLDPAKQTLAAQTPEETQENYDRGTTLSPLGLYDDTLEFLNKLFKDRGAMEEFKAVLSNYDQNYVYKRNTNENKRKQTIGKQTMKITTSYLKRIIKEERDKLLQEAPLRLKKRGVRQQDTPDMSGPTAAPRSPNLRLGPPSSDMSGPTAAPPSKASSSLALTPEEEAAGWELLYIKLGGKMVPLKKMPPGEMQRMRDEGEGGAGFDAAQAERERMQMSLQEGKITASHLRRIVIEEMKNFKKK